MSTTPDTTPTVPAAGSARLVEWEIVLSGGHPDIYVRIQAPENATDTELQALAENEAMAKTYIWSKRKVQPNTEPSGGPNKP